MRRAENSWSTTPQAECILFFAQLVREQASIESLPSFRANSLDTVARLKEASFVLRDIESGKVSNLSAAPFLEEIQWSLKSDLALRAIADGAHSIILDRIAAKSTNSQLQTSIEFLYKKALPNYQKTIEGLITDVVLDTNSRHLLRNLTSSYISFLINNGYTRDYISKTIKESFFTKDMPKVGINTVRTFFKYFQGIEHKYLVYIPCSKKFANALSRLHVTVLQNHKLPPHIQAAYASVETKKDWAFVVVNLSTKDPFLAAEMSENTLNMIQTINFLGPQVSGYAWDALRYVIPRKAQKGWFITPPSLAGPRRTIQRPGNSSLRSVFSGVMREFGQSSVLRLIISLNTSDLIERHSIAESRFLSIWSAVEILLGDPPRGTPRIVHYADSILPCICVRHMRSLISSVFDRMQFVYRNDLNKIIRQEADFVGADFHTRFAAIFMIGHNQPLRDQLIALCDGNPLARHRLSQIYNIYKSPKDFYSYMKDHEDRVRWQIYRIYRARNILIHGGMKEAYFESISAHLFDYYKAAIWSIIRQASKDDDRSGLQAVVKEISVEYELYKNKVSSIKAAAFEISDLKNLIAAAT